MVEADCSGSFGCRSPKQAPRGRTRFCASPVLPGLARRCAGWSGLGAGIPPGRGKRGSRFRVPPGGAKGPSPLQWQGPSPLPQRPADHRPAAGQSPRPAARPAHGGRFAPPGSGAGLRWCRWHRSWRKRSARAGKCGSRFLLPPGPNLLSSQSWLTPAERKVIFQDAGPEPLRNPAAVKAPSPDISRRSLKVPNLNDPRGGDYNRDPPST